jgi:hypothetical protein
MDTCRVAAVLAADAELDVGPGLALRFLHAIRTSSPTPSISSVTNGSCSMMPFCCRSSGRTRRIVARNAEGGLGQVVGAEGEELGSFGNLIRLDGRHAAARSWCRQIGSMFSPVSASMTLRMHGRDPALTKSSSSRRPTSGTITSGTTGAPVISFLDLAGLEDGAGLHLGNFRVGDRQPAAAMAQHRVELVQLIDAGAQQLHRDVR